MKPDIDQKLQILQPVIGKIKAARLRMTYYFEDDYRAKRELESHIDLLISRLVKTEIADQIVLPPPPADACQGDIKVGTVEYMGKPMHDFNLNLKSLTRHTGIFGSTGSGKTTLALNLIRQLHKSKVPFMIFDWEKSYRNLAKEFNDAIVFTLGSDINPLYLNPLHLPPGISKEEYAKSIISIIAEDYLSGAGSDTVLLNYIKTAYLENQNPTFNDLKEVALKDLKKPQRGRTMLWKETVGRIITSLSIGTAGQVFGSGRHHPLNQLLGKNVVLELGGIQSPRDRKLIVHLILNKVFLWLQHRGIESESLKQAIIFEEFHNIAMKGNEDNLVGSMFRQCRKYGLGLIAIDQTPSEIPNEIYGNMNTKISFSLSTNRDISAMAKAMNMDAGKSRFLGMLQTGEAIVNVKQGYPEPFLVRPPFVPEGPTVTDEELKKRSVSQLAFSELSPHVSGQLSSIREFRHPETSSPYLSPVAKILIQNIAEKPFLPVSKRYKILGLSMDKGNIVKSEIIQKGYARSQTVDGMTLLDLTQRGRAEAELAGAKMQPYKGGIEHSYWVNKTTQYLKKHGFQPVMEAQDIDITDIAAGIAIEIETGKSDIIKNLQKLSKLDNSHFKARFALSTNKETEFKIKEMVKPYPSIQELFIKDFLKLTKEQLLSHQSHSPGKSEAAITKQ